jgi:hypothetical protein
MNDECTCCKKHADERRFVRLMFALILLMIICLIVRGAHGQTLPDAPSQSVRADTAPVPAATCGRFHWSCWRDVQRLSTAETFRNHSYQWYVIADGASIVWDAENTHAGLARTYPHTAIPYCTEGSQFLPAHPSRGQLYAIDIPEFAAVSIFGFVATKTKMPRWLMFGTDAYPVQVHFRAGLRWLEDCR